VQRNWQNHTRKIPRTQKRTKKLSQISCRSFIGSAAEDVSISTEPRTEGTEGVVQSHTQPLLNIECVSKSRNGNQGGLEMIFKIITILLVLGFLFMSASAFKDVDSVNDAIPVLQKTGVKMYESGSTTIDYFKELFNIWNDSKVI
jgi:hypothetical protein